MKIRAFSFVCILVWMSAVAPSLQAQFNFNNLNPEKIADGLTKVAKGSTGVGHEEEMSIGGSVAVEIVAMNGGLWKDEEATRRVNLIGKTLARYSDRPALPYRFGILDSDAINGYSAPGGYVFITKGAYLAAADDDQLAGVLAHEIAHVTRRHALRIISRAEFISGLSDVAAGSSSDYSTYDVGIDDITNTLLKNGYDSGSEYDADRMGSELAWSAGFRKDGLEQFLEGLKAGGHESSQLFSTHPPLASRVERLRSDR